MINKLFITLLFLCFTCSVFSQLVGYQPRAFLPTRFVVDDQPATISSVINVMENGSKQQKMMGTSMGMKNASSFMLLGGVGMMGSYFVDYSRNSRLKGRVFVAGVVLTLGSIPLVGISNRKAGNAIELHNRSLTSQRNSIEYEWRINYSSDGIGIAYVW